MADPKDRQSKTPGEVAVPKAVVARLSLYLRQLELFAKQNRETVSSSQLGKALAITDAQVRKDLAYFGQFGYPGIGYRTAELADGIRRILGTDKTWPVALVGVGNLGRALVGYRGFPEQSFKIDALFDNDPKKIGSTYVGHTVHSLDELPRVIGEEGIRLAMIAVPADAAQQVADQLVAAGIQGILNFAPTTLNVPERVHFVVVDLTVQLEQLSFLVAGGQTRKSDPRDTRRRDSES